MKFCSNCKASVTGQRKYCPLCQSELEEKDLQDDGIFPVIPTIFHKYNLFFRILILVSVIVGVLSVTVNILIPTKVWWSLFSVAGICCFWVITAIAVSKRTNMPKNILYQVFVLSVLALLWDWLTHWRAWSINYFIPIVSIIAILSMAIIAKVTKLNVRDYIVYLMIDILFGIIPIVFLALQTLYVLWPSLICIASSMITLTTLILFEGDNMRMELNRRLHM